MAPLMNECIVSLVRHHPSSIHRVPDRRPSSCGPAHHVIAVVHSCTPPFTPAAGEKAVAMCMLPWSVVPGRIMGTSHALSPVEARYKTPNIGAERGH